MRYYVVLHAALDAARGTGELTSINRRLLQQHVLGYRLCLVQANGGSSVRQNNGASGSAAAAILLVLHRCCSFWYVVTPRMPS